MVLDINIFRKDKGGNPDLVKESQQRRFASVDLVQEVIDADTVAKKFKHEWEMKKAESGKIQKEIGQKAKAKQPFDDLKQRRTEIEAEVKAAEPELERLERDLHSKLNRIGNIVHASVRVSKNEDENEIVRTWGAAETKGGLKHHYELLELIDGVDCERGVKVAGNRGYFLKGNGLLLNQALIAYGMQFLVARQHTPIQTPFFMNKDVMAATAQLEDFDEQLYKVAGSSRTHDAPASPAAPVDPKDKAAVEKAAVEKAALEKLHQSDLEEKYLIATSEQPISAMHMDEYIHEDDLPINYAGYSMCFRKEAGQMRDARGIFRVHQFEKIEQFAITHPEKSWEAHEEMIKHSEEFYQSLGIPYRVVVIVSGALNNAAAKKYDLEGWFPAFQNYRELVSCSNCTDYQSRSLNVKMRGKKEDKEHKFVHMLNSTLCATTRTICAIVENHQTADGINVPEVLRRFLGGKAFIPFVEKKKKH